MEIIIANGRHADQAKTVTENWRDGELDIADHIWFCTNGFKFCANIHLPEMATEFARIPEHWGRSCMYHLVNAHKRNTEMPEMVFVRAAYGCEDDMFQYHLFDDEGKIQELVQYANENIPAWQALFFECAMLYIDSLHLPRLRYEKD
jgi:hypothetical protein